MRILARLRTFFLAGILVTAPIGITVYLTWLVIDVVDARVMPLVPARYNPESYLPFGIPGLGVIVAVIFLILIGALTAGLAGRWIVGAFERLMRRMPVVRQMYATLRQIFETVLAHQSKAFRQVVLVEYPREGLWSVGFLIGDTGGEVQHRSEDDVLNVFLPTTPNPTAGFLLFVPRSRVRVLDMSAEQGAQLVMSGGIISPSGRRPQRAPGHARESRPSVPMPGQQ